MRIARASVFRVFSVIGFLLAASAAPATADPVVKTLYAFCPRGYPDCPDGAKPQASLVRDAAGNIFGTTMDGGKSTGTVFEVTP
ncbi:MAG TPA: hypothetical protein VHZ29_10095 [Rhizomicrobium sp.]|jgi:hypothetical protein|nr:hypothetical protein [Rhizomicrobium sp.]